MCIYMGKTFFCSSSLHRNIVFGVTATFWDNGYFWPLPQAFEKKNNIFRYNYRFEQPSMRSYVCTMNMRTLPVWFGHDPNRTVLLVSVVSQFFLLCLVIVDCHLFLLCLVIVDCERSVQEDWSRWESNAVETREHPHPLSGEVVQG